MVVIAPSTVATDAPWDSFGAAFAKIEGMDVDEAVRDQLFWKNAAQLYRFTESPAH